MAYDIDSMVTTDDDFLPVDNLRIYTCNPRILSQKLLLSPVIPSGAQRNRGISRLRGARFLDSTALRFVPPRPARGRLLEMTGGLARWQGRHPE
jgi:hypothetical protein